MKMFSRNAAAVTGACLLLAGCTSPGAFSERTQTLMRVSSSIGLAKSAAHWYQADLNPETYKGATEEELGSLRARAQILAAEAEKVNALCDKFDLFEPSPNDPSMANLLAWQQELDTQRHELTRNLQVLQVRLGIRTPEDAASREESLDAAIEAALR